MIEDSNDLPLCVDLDGTLIKTDSLHESAFGAAFTDLRVFLHLPGWLLSGKAKVKQELAKRWFFDPAFLPYSDTLLNYLRTMRSRGRKIILVTAADQAIAEPIARHVGFFDEVIASNGTDNLRGARKAAALCERFGPRGFVYAGNDYTDYAVWEHSAAAILVNTSPSVRRRAEKNYPVDEIIEDARPARLKAALKAIRPYQWIKNLLIFVPLLAAGDFLNLDGWISAFITFVAFSAIASAIYLFNDMGDLAADRTHPRNKLRPFASGALSVKAGVLLIPLLSAIGLYFGWVAGSLSSLGLYALLSLAYNIKLKEMPLIDVFLLAALYTVRLMAGSEATGHPLSMWLLGFSSFLFLSLALVKRVSELRRLRSEQKEGAARRGYLTTDLEMLQLMGCAGSFASAVVLSLYIQSDDASQAYANAKVLWGIIPLMLFWQCRLWLSTARGYMHDDPIVYAARDWVSWLVFACLLVLVAAAHMPHMLNF